MSLDLTQANQSLIGKSPQEIVTWALAQGSAPILTTNFRPYESVISIIVHS